jgi:hypothetical protein
VAALKDAKESRKRKKPTFRTCKRMLKRLRKGTNNKRLKELNKMYRYPGGDALGLFQTLYWPAINTSLCYFVRPLSFFPKLGSSIGKGDLNHRKY